MFRSVAIFFCTIAMSIAAHALPASGPVSALDAFQQEQVNAFVAKWPRTSAIQVAMVRDSDGALLFSKCYGWEVNPIYKSEGKQCDPRTVFGLASMSKQMTDRILVELIRQEKVRADQPVFCVPGKPRAGCILDNVISYNGIWKAGYENVTVNLLLAQRSGLVEGFLGAGGHRVTKELAGYTDPLPLAKNRLAGFHVAHWSLGYEPGTSYAPVNIDFFFKSMIIEKVTGLKFEEAMHSMVTRKLGIRDEDFKVCVNQTQNSDVFKTGVLPTRGYDYRQTWKDPIFDVKTTASAGRSEYVYDDSKLYPLTLESEAIESRDGAWGLCATAEVYARFASQTTRDDIGLISDSGSTGSWSTTGRLPGVGALAQVRQAFSGMTAVVLVNSDQLVTDNNESYGAIIAHSARDLKPFVDGITVRSNEVSANLWPSSNPKLVKSYEYTGPTFNGDGKPRYFITSDAAQQAVLDGLSQFRAVESWQAWETQSLAGDGSFANMCRWFFPQVSSHFYSPKEAECKLLGWVYPERDDKGGVYESQDHAIKKPDAAGVCTDGLKSLYRGFNGATSNHRYTTNAATRAAFAANGFTDEGVQGCVR
jgi:CubicO group peptidase (beta-lactamase class C family)